MQLDLLGVGEHAGGDIGCLLVVGHRPLGPSGPRILLGKLGRDAIYVFGVEQLQALGDAPVQQPPPGRADPGVCRFA